MSQEIARPGLMEILRRTLNMKGARSPAGILTPEVTPSLVLEMDRPEWSILAGELRVGTTAEGDLGAASEDGFWEILNPAGSNALAVIEHLWVTNVDGTACYNLGVGDIQSADGGQGGFGCMDARYRPTLSASPLLHRFNGAGVGTWVLLHHENGDQNEDVDMIPEGYPVILPPGTACALVIFGDAVAEHYEFAAQARVRQLEPSELIKAS